ncbi:dicarboxylate symporter family protein, partial [Vibrio parahaemolyticus EKP-028]
LRFLKAERVQ